MHTPNTNERNAGMEDEAFHALFVVVFAFCGVLCGV